MHRPIEAVQRRDCKAVRPGEQGKERRSTKTNEQHMRYKARDLEQARERLRMAQNESQRQSDAELALHNGNAGRKAMSTEFARACADDSR